MTGRTQWSNVWRAWGDQFWSAARQFPNFPRKISKENIAKKNQSHKISERKNYFVLSFTKNVRLFKHHDLLACVIVCNSCEKSWFWQPENTLITHYSVRICADVWPLCWQKGVCHTTLRRLGRRKQRNMKGNLFELKHHCLIWEFKKQRRRHHRRSRFKNELILYLRVSRYSKVTLETEHETQR